VAGVPDVAGGPAVADVSDVAGGPAVVGVPAIAGFPCYCCLTFYFVVSSLS